MYKQDSATITRPVVLVPGRLLYTIAMMSWRMPQRRSPVIRRTRRRPYLTMMRLLAMMARIPMQERTLVMAKGSETFAMVKKYAL